MCKNTEGAINRKIQRNWQYRVHKTQDKYISENTEGAIKKTIQRNWQHRVHKTQDK
jgi:hypothetical protein